MAAYNSSTRRFDLIVRGGLLVDPELGTAAPGDLAIVGGRIAAVGTNIETAGAGVYDASGLLVTPGLIDLHTHVYDQRTGLGLSADTAGVQQAVTTVVDAGSCGSDHWRDFADTVVAPAATRVLSWLNISRHGLVHGNRELSGGADDIDAEATAALLAAHPETVRGIKIRMSRSVLGDSGLAPLRTATSLARSAGLPVMVHVGNAPPAFGDVLDLLDAGDVVTHAFHGKSGGLFGGGAEPIPQARAALERGVRFDVGHGSASFAYRTAERALAAGVQPYSISTDLHQRNVDGPVHSMASTMSKLLELGMSLPDVVRCGTLHPARVLGLESEIGVLRPGAIADLSVLELHPAAVQLTDSEGETRHIERQLLPRAAVRAGVVHPSRKAGAV